MSGLTRKINKSWPTVKAFLLHFSTIAPIIVHRSQAINHRARVIAHRAIAITHRARVISHHCPTLAHSSLATAYTLLYIYAREETDGASANDGWGRQGDHCATLPNIRKTTGNHGADLGRNKKRDSAESQSLLTLNLIP